MLNDIRLLLRHKPNTLVDSCSPPIRIEIIKYLSNTTYNCERKNSNPTSCLVLYLCQLITYYTLEIKGAKSQQKSIRISITLHYASQLDLPHFNVKIIQHKQAENAKPATNFGKIIVIKPLKSSYPWKLLLSVACKSHNIQKKWTTPPKSQIAHLAWYQIITQCISPIKEAKS